MPPRQKILDFLSSRIADGAPPPTLREIAKHCGISSIGSVSHHLQALEREGRVKRSAALSRGVELTSSPLRLPILGRVGAGGQIIAQEDVEGYLSLDKDQARGAQFLLRVRGQSMTGAGILEGDLVQVRGQRDAQDGDIVVALIEETAMVKRLRRGALAWSLESAHPDHPPIAREFALVGKVVGLIRRYGS